MKLSYILYYICLMKVNFKPIGEKLLVEAHPIEEQVNWIYIVDSVRHYRKGTVVATNSDIPLHLGDVVTYAPSAGVPITLDSINYTLLKVDEVYGIIE